MAERRTTPVNWHDGTTPSVNIYAATAALTGILAVHAYHLVEDPVRRSGWLEGSHRQTTLQVRHTAKRLAFLGSTLAISLGAVLVVDLVLSPAHTEATVAAVVDDGSPKGRLAAQIVAATQAPTFPKTSPSLEDQKAWVPEQMTTGGCLNPDLANLTACTYGHGNKLAIVVGDSVAMSFIPAVVAALGPDGYRVHGVGISNCPFGDVQTVVKDDPQASERCNGSKAGVAGQIAALRPDRVISTDYEYNLLRTVIPTGADTAALLRLWQSGLEKSIRMAQSYGARVVVLAPDPEGVAAESCVSRVSVPASCIKPIAGSWHQKSGAESAAAAATGARYVDSRPFFCTREMVCPS